ncbi:MAG: tRNA (adenosine(37)-N6)-dimethylallyltransferase MiaA [Candidatus Pacebacteria bacterium]|nr:tRNA (adenosine(37)-N6)-dimethylallyltransferase MiaA [Candidatus Paceibacterota bacterium]
MKKYHILTFGCQMNKADSERIAASLERKGYKTTPNLNEADLIVVNMCSIRQSAVDRIYGLAPGFEKLKIRKPKLKTILTGCITKMDRKKFAEKFDLIVDKEKYLTCPPKHSNKLMAYISISNGCNNACSYCIVPFTRGRLVCRDHREILKEVKNAVANGVKEIWLLGQNVNDYHSPRDSSINFAELLKKVSDIPGNFKILFTSPHPKNFSDELIDALAECGKFGRYLNLPVQSGDNTVLRRMNRPYTVQQYKNLVKKIREKMPDINLSTDVIVGFPGETKSQFKNTVKLFKELNFDMAYISKFSPRPGTAAIKMKNDVSRREKEKRWEIINEFILKKLKEKKEIGKKKLIAVLGPTASGKSALAVKLAKKFNGEVISADSRQIYKRMNLGTGKITKREMKGVPHYLLDVASPKNKFTVVQYRKLAIQAINKIFKKGKVPIICGGTGFYIQAVIDGIMIPEVKPDWKLRKELELIATKNLFNKLKKLDPERTKNIDKNNRRRLIRALEILIKTKKPVPPFKKQPLPYPVLIIGIKKSKEELKELIRKRLLKRFRQGMIDEIKKLRKSGVSWKRLEEFGLEYRYIAQYLQKKLNYGEMIEKLQKETEHFAKRQITWFKRDERIHWIKKQPQAEELVKEFLKST